MTKLSQLFKIAAFAAAVAGCAPKNSSPGTRGYPEGFIVFRGLCKKCIVLIDDIPVKKKDSEFAVPVSSGPHKVEIIAGDSSRIFFVEIYPGGFVTITSTPEGTGR